MRLCSCMDPYRVRPVAQGEIKNRCTIGRLFCIIRKRGGGKKREREFSNRYSRPFFGFFRLIFCGLRFFSSFFFSSFSRMIYQPIFLFFFLFATRKREFPFREDGFWRWSKTLSLSLSSPFHMSHYGN